MTSITPMETLLSQLVKAKCFDIVPVSVTIGEGKKAVTYQGAQWKKTCILTPGCRAYEDARREGREPSYTIEAWQLLGCIVAPNNYGKRFARDIYHRHAFTHADGRTFYVSSYTGDLIVPEQYRCVAAGGEHPTFQIRVWDVADAIDAWEEKPYKRLPLHIETLDAPQVPASSE